MNKLHDGGCRVCQKRAGSWYGSCCINHYGRHGSGKKIYSKKYRSFKSWKHNRKKQWQRF